MTNLAYREDDDDAARLQGYVALFEKLVSMVELDFKKVPHEKAIVIANLQQSELWLLKASNALKERKKLQRPNRTAR